MKKFELYCLGGNETAIITKNLPDAEALVLSKQIMRENPEVEQVAIIESVKNNVCNFRMTGGEFCGNAVRAVAEFMRRNFGFSKSKIIINGIEIEGESNGRTSTITLPKKSLLREVKTLGGRTYVVMNGITHVVVDGRGDEVLARKIKDDATARGITNDAFGVMFLDGNKINPFVWVEKAQTFFNETACLSGSIAVSIFLNQTKIIQPTNETYTIEITDTKITAGGKVAFIDKETTTKLEQGFVKYADLVGIKKCNPKTDKEALVTFGDVLVRESVFQKLGMVDKNLKAINPNLELVVVEGWRPMKVQEAKFNEIREQLKFKYTDEQELLEAVHRLIAVPSVCGHPTGGAVDVTIRDTITGELLDFGTPIHDLSTKDVYTFSPRFDENSVGRKNRELLRRAMVEQNFAPFDGEWWHFSYGDKEWAVYYGLEQFLYGAR
ncbi:MAG: hypothetical protein FWC00_00705 [Firmicutes bacterium]|nr:hypothetical protein [Bacillota bacterium]